MATSASIKRNNERSEVTKAHHAEAQELWNYLESLDGSDDSVLRKIQQAGGSIYGLDDKGNIQKSGPI